MEGQPENGGEEDETHTREGPKTDEELSEDG